MKLKRLQLLATIAISSLLGACASTQSQSDIKLHQEETLQRWVSCLDRQTEVGSASDTMLRVNVYCEGHKRDLLAAYPPHLHNQVNEVLSQRTQKLAAEQHVKHESYLKDGAMSVTLK